MSLSKQFGENSFDAGESWNRLTLLPVPAFVTDARFLFSTSLRHRGHRPCPVV